MSYADLEKHQTECDYATIKCTNYGCEVEMSQKDYVQHEQSCEFKISRCDKCEVVKPKGVEHDCVKSMSAKYEHLSAKLAYVSQRLDKEMEIAERNRMAEDKGTQLVRHDIVLPALSQIKFSPSAGWHQVMTEQVGGLPPNTRTLILRFGLTDLNVRREFSSLVVY